MRNTSGRLGQALNLFSNFLKRNIESLSAEMTKIQRRKNRRLQTYSSSSDNTGCGVLSLLYVMFGCNNNIYGFYTVILCVLSIVLFKAVYNLYDLPTVCKQCDFNE